MGTTVLQRSIYVSYYINVNVLSLMLVLYALAIHAQRGNQREKLMFTDFRKFYFFKYIALLYLIFRLTLISLEDVYKNF